MVLPRPAFVTSDGAVASAEAVADPRRRRRLTAGDIRLALVAADAIAVIVAIAVAFRTDAALPVSSKFVLVVVVLGAASLSRLYRRADLMLTSGTLEETRGLLQVVTVAMLAVALMTEGGAELIDTVMFGGALLITLLAFRAQVRRITRSISAAERTVVVGQPERFDTFRRHLAAAQASTEVTAWLDIAHVGDTLADVQAIVDRHDAERVIVLADEPALHAAHVARRARKAGATVTVAPYVAASLGPDVMTELVGGSLTFTAGSSTLTSGQRALKRTVDLVGASLLILFMAPVLAAVALAVKVTSAGPILFWQTRVGKNGRRFRIAKFRTMVADAERLKDDLRMHNEADGIFKMAADPRITRIGRWLRRSSLDELPQLLNVIRGDMSLVGPRPLVRDEDAKVEGWQRDRLGLPPGMTGPWQIMGSARIPLRDMVLLDYHYVSNWSVWSDVRILLRTATFVVCGRGL
jgi:exopolysaccharide biosynthesis polyprenyl glycosylphosphotransferase